MAGSKRAHTKSRFSLFKVKKQLTEHHILSNVAPYAEVVELVDTLASGASGGNPVEVRVLFSVPLSEFTIRNESQ